MSSTASITKMVDDAIFQKLEAIKFYNDWKDKQEFRDEQYNLFYDSLKMRAKEIGFDVNFSSNRGEYDANGVMIKPPMYDFYPRTNSLYEFLINSNH
jgi:hypothetical protein